MSVLFGRCNFNDEPVAADFLARVRVILAPYGPDGANSYSKDGESLLYCPFYTPKESRRETQPSVTASGLVITWDGRLDNHAELITSLRDTLSTDSTDVSIVTAAYKCWGTNCFAKLIGDSALSIWNADDRSLTLARDCIGIRQLY